MGGSTDLLHPLPEKGKCNPPVKERERGKSFSQGGGKKTGGMGSSSYFLRCEHRAVRERRGLILHSEKRGKANLSESRVRGKEGLSLKKGKRGDPWLF